ncbi:MAG: hypothetical protein ACXU86_05300 [Archangium sp.]
MAEGAELLDPFKVGKDPSLFRQQLSDMLDVLAQQFAQDLSPKDRKAGAALAVDAENAGPDSVNTTGREPPAPARPSEPAVTPGELPDPEP